MFLFFYFLLSSDYEEIDVSASQARQANCSIIMCRYYVLRHVFDNGTEKEECVLEMSDIDHFTDILILSSS